MIQGHTGTERTTVVNLRYAPHAHTVCIGRPSKWGNPFVIGKHGSRQFVIARYCQYLRSQPQLLAALHELEGQALGCWCAPLACHGDVLAALANAPCGHRGDVLEQLIKASAAC
jgi:Domain of unknown function (DUF4326)